MHKNFLHHATVVAMLILIGSSSLLAQEPEPPTQGSRFISFTTFRPKFHNDTETFSMMANFYIVNASPQTLVDVIYRQTFPAEMKPQLVSDAVESQLSHPPEFWHKFEGSTYVMYEPKIYRRQPATILTDLSLERRMSTFTLPPTEIEFSILTRVKKGGEREVEAGQTDKTLPVTIDVTEYANHVGDLERFLRKKAGIGLDVAVSGRDLWEFSPIDAVATGKNPQGIIGVHTSDNGYSGNFRLHNGLPGDALDILVVWKSTRKDDSLQDENAVMESVSEYLKWTGPFKFVPESIKISKAKFKKYKSWILEGRWYDTIPNHLGEGPMKALVFYSGREDVEYTIILQAQGRGVGEGKADVPAPEKEKELMDLQEKILDTFRSDIIPISHKR